MLSGMVRDEEDRSRLQLASAVAVGDVHPQNASWLALRCAILQRVDAGVLAGHESFRPLDMDLTEHPSEGPCESDPREAITGFGPTVLEGQRPSSFKGAEIRDIKGECTMPPCVAARSDETEVVARYPFVCEVSTLRASASRAHSLFGSGLDIELLFPEKGWCRPFNLLDMNERDLDERRFIDFLGSWRLDGGNAIFHSFMPNGFFTPGAGQLQFRSMPTRARWYAENVCGDDWDAGGYRVACEFWQEQGKGARAKRWLGKLFGGRRR
jgi:hypothetical protein